MPHRTATALALVLLLLGLAAPVAPARAAQEDGAAPTGAAMSRGNPARTGAQPGPGVAGMPSLRWAFPTGGAVRSTPAVLDGTVYVGSKDGNVYALDAATGAERWRFATGGPVVASPAVGDGSVFVGSFDGMFYALDAATGEQRWRFRTQVTASPTIVDGTVYVVSNGVFTNPQSVMHAFDAATGLERWHFVLTWGSFGGPTIVGRTVYLTDVLGFITALDKDTGQVIWTRQEISIPTSPPVVAGGLLYYVGVTITGGDGTLADVVVSSPEGEEESKEEDENDEEEQEEEEPLVVASAVIALDAETGNPRWTSPFSNTWLPWSNPAVVDGLVYVGTDTGQLMAFDALSGRSAWGAYLEGAITSSPSVVDNLVYVGGFDGQLHARDAKTGLAAWTFPTGHSIGSSATVVDGVAYIGSDDGQLYAIGGS